MMEKFDESVLMPEKIENDGNLSDLRKAYTGFSAPEDGIYNSFDSEMIDSIQRWVNIDGIKNIDYNVADIISDIKEMYSGVEYENGNSSLSLERIKEYKLNPEYKDINVKQQSGFAAEVIGTVKENIQSKCDDLNEVMYRVDDLVDQGSEIAEKNGFIKNDQYVDKVRIDSAGNIIERIQVKFVGKNGKECLSKLLSKDFDKYFTDGKVDTIEIPSDFYDEIKNGDLINNKINDYQKQLEKVKEMGKTEEITKLENNIERCKQLDSMLKRSTVSSTEACMGRLHPKQYITKLIANQYVVEGNKIGIENAKIAATLTAAVSTVDNTMKVVSGEISVQEAVIDIAKDTGTSTLMAYGTGFITSTASLAMAQSSHQLIQSLASTGLPAAVITVGVESFDTIVAFSEGKIDSTELAYLLGEDVAQSLGALGGMAVVSVIVPGGGPVLMIGSSLIASTIGGAIAAEAYHSAVEMGSEAADVFAEKAQEYTTKTIEMVEQYIPESVDSVKEAFSDFISQNNLPFSI